MARTGEIVLYKTLVYYCMLSIQYTAAEGTYVTYSVCTVLHYIDRKNDKRFDHKTNDYYPFETLLLYTIYLFLIRKGSILLCPPHSIIYSIIYYY